MKEADLEVGRQLGLLPIALQVVSLFLDESESYLAVWGMSPEASALFTRGVCIYYVHGVFISLYTLRK